MFLMLSSGYLIYVKKQGIFLTQDTVETLKTFAEKGKWESLRLYAQFIMKHPELGDTVKARQYLELAETEIHKRKSLIGRIKRFLKGMATGEPEDVESFLGSLTLDLFLIGDIRDLIIQGFYKPVIKNEKPDVFIAALASIGVATTVYPHVDIGVSAAKLFKKLKIFSKRFVKILEKIARESIKTRKFEKLTSIAGDIGKITLKTGVAPTADMVKYVNTADELKVLTKSVEKNSVETYGVIISTDGKALKSLESGETALEITDKLRKSSKLSKVLKITRFLKIQYKLLSILSIPVLAIIFVLSFILLILTFRGTGRKEYQY